MSYVLYVCVVRKYWTIYFGMTIGGYTGFYIEQHIRKYVTATVCASVMYC